MATPVSNSMSKLAASNVAFNADNARNGAGTSNTRFPDLLRGQIQTATGARSPAPAPSRPPAMEAARARQPDRDRAPSREPSRTPVSTSPRQSPAHEPQAPGKHGNPPAHAAKQPANGKLQDAIAASAATNPDVNMADSGEIYETGAAPSDTVLDDTVPDGTVLDDAVPDNPVPDDAMPDDAVLALVEAPIQTVNVVVTPVLPATIAAPSEVLAKGDAIADADTGSARDGATVEVEDTGIETPPRNAGRPRRAAMATGIGAHPAGNGTAAKAASASPAAISTTAASTAAISNTVAATAGSQAADVPGLRADVLAARTDMGARAASANADANPPPIPNALRTSTQESAVLPRFTIPAAAGQRAWAEEAGNKIMWMLGRAETRAELILTPPHLGKVEVSINLNGDQTTAQFVASSQAAREALEQAMPRLRELLAQAGIDLGNASVDTSAEGRTRDDDAPRTANRASASHDGGHDGGNDDATGVTSAHWTRQDNGLINTFA
ncbi:MAG: flagellar hook-length control protein FliK [Azoarcus sp.]|jgi:flagellar hook-length control protein FliK|nr:flagellar hook-length control protein FliK [Azoarcus sp.]